MRYSLVLLALLVLAGCGITKDARIYDLDSGNIIHATFTWYGRQGPIEARLPAGELCKGEYTTIPGGAVGWGTIFNSTGQSASSFSSAMPLSHRGAAVATCPSGLIMECEYMTSGSTSGTGACRDNRGGRYRLMF